MDDIGVRIDDKAVAALIAPGIVQPVSAITVGARDLYDAVKTSLRGAKKRTKEVVETRYEGKWGGESIEQRVDLTEKRLPIAHIGRTYMASNAVIKRAHAYALAKLIEATRPRRVLEVGCGSGVNLFALAPLFPDVAFTGIELTKDGVAKATEFTTLPTLPEYMQAYLTEPARDLTAHQRVKVVQGTAAALPFEDGSFDLVFTSNALEQMQVIRDQALSELRRVSSGHVAMIEAFREWNGSFRRRSLIRNKGFFDCSIVELPRHGLIPVFNSNRLPHKTRYAVGMVVTRPAA